VPICFDIAVQQFTGEIFRVVDKFFHWHSKILLS
jgi:hypothetical protein